MKKMTTTPNKQPTLRLPHELKKEKEQKGDVQNADKKNQDRQNNKNDQREQRPDQRDRKDNNRFDNKNRSRGGGRPYNQRGGRGGGGGGFRSDGGHQGGGYGQGNHQAPDFTGEIQNEEPKEPKKFTGRCRLFVGNITPDTTEEQFKEMFTKFGEVSELFVNAARGFGFIRLDYRINAEKAKLELDGQVRNNRVLRVRFATHGAALKVTNLSPFVSNELLEDAFSQFGEVERAVVCVDDRGRSYGEGIVEFARKPGANSALKRIGEGVFLLSSYPRPVRVEPLEQKDEEDGLTERFVQKNDGYMKDRDKDPRFAPPGSFEFEFGLKHRRIDDMEKERIEAVKREMDMERTRLAEEMETAVFDYQADQIRQDLMRQQEELKRLEEMKNEQVRRRQEMDLRRQEQMRGPAESAMMRMEEERRREMMMRANGGMNRDRDGNIIQGGPGGPRGPPPPNRPEEMMRGEMRGGPPPGMRDERMPPGMRDERGPPGMRDERPPQGIRDERPPQGIRDERPPQGMRDERPPQGMRDERPPGPGMREERGIQRGPGTPPMPPPPVPPGMNMEQGPPEGRFQKMEGGDRSPGEERGIKQEQMQRPGPQGNRFQGPPGPGNFPQNIGGPPGNLFPKMQGGLGNNMGGNDRRRGEGGPRRDDFENKRMRRF